MGSCECCAVVDPKRGDGIVIYTMVVVDDTSDAGCRCVAMSSSVSLSPVQHVGIEKTTVCVVPSVVRGRSSCRTPECMLNVELGVEDPYTF